MRNLTREGSAMRGFDIADDNVTTFSEITLISDIQDLEIEYQSQLYFCLKFSKIKIT
jgi:hypothetical protein